MQQKHKTGGFAWRNEPDDILGKASKKKPGKFGPLAEPSGCHRVGLYWPQNLMLGLDLSFARHSKLSGVEMFVNQHRSGGMKHQWFMKQASASFILFHQKLCWHFISKPSKWKGIKIYTNLSYSFDILVLGSEGNGPMAPMAIGRHYMSLYFFSLFLVKLFTLYLTGAQKHNGRDFTLRVLGVLASSGWLQSVTDLNTALLNPRQHHRPSCAL